MVAVSLVKVAMRCIFATLGLLISMLTLASHCLGSDLVFIRPDQSVSSEQKAIQAAASFYGLSLRIITVTSDADNLSIRALVEQEETVGVVIDANTLAAVDK